MLSQNICNSIHQWLVASTLTLMGITIDCREGLKYLQAIWGQVYVHTLSLTHTDTCTHLHTCTQQMALWAELGFCRIQGRKAHFCHRVWGSRTLGCWIKLSLMYLLCLGQTILTLSLQDLHTNFMGMLFKCLQSALQPFLNSVVIHTEELHRQI